MLRKVLRKSLVTYQTDMPSEAAALPRQTEQPVSVLGKLESCGLMTADGLKYCAGDEEFYLSMLREFAAEYPSRAEKMRGFLAADDLKNYEILVHALKSNLKMIGSNALSESAKELEFAARDGNDGLIAERHGALDAACSELASALNALLGGNAEPGTDAGEIMEVLPDDDAVTEFEPYREEQ